jgi:hypothetical protein
MRIMEPCPICSVPVKDHSSTQAIDRCKRMVGTNNDCCGAGPHTPGEVRVMPCGGDSNLILCRSCWLREIVYRRERNSALGEFARYSLPAWDTAEVYYTGE